jgi:hypothetical protein
VKEVYLDIKNPKIINSYEEIGGRVGISKDEAKAISDNLKAEGYDGVIYRGPTTADDEYVVFDASQIKVNKQKVSLEAVDD